MPAASTGYEVVHGLLDGTTSPLTLNAPTGTAITAFWVQPTASGDPFLGDVTNLTFDGSGNLVAVEFTRGGGDRDCYITCVGL